MILELIHTIEMYQFIFITDSLKSEIKYYLTQLLPQLNPADMNIIVLLTLYIIEDISVRYHFGVMGHKQWTKNNGRDISSLALTLIPYIGDLSYDTIMNLTDIIYVGNEKTISSDLLEMDRLNAIKKYFPYSNFTLGLLNQNNDTSLLNLYETGQHTIYHCIEHNFISMLETIKITNGKLFVNWLNIIPMADYKTSALYRDSMVELNSIVSKFDEKHIKTVLNNNKGLWIGDYYNVLTNGFFVSIKQVKWLIFCKRVNTKYYYMLQYLNHMIDLSVIFNNNDYNSMSDIEKSKFNDSIKKWHTSLKDNIPIYIDIDFEVDILKNLFSFMLFNYSKGQLVHDDIKNDFEVNVYDSSIDLDPSEIEIKKIKFDKVLNATKVVDPNHVWEYIKEALTLFQSSPYGKYIIKNNIIDMNFFNIVEDETMKINLKNIYNIAKICCHNIIDKKFVYIGNSFKSLDEYHTMRFFAYYASQSMGWLQIKNNIQIQEVDNYNLQNIMNRMEKAWNHIKVNIVWDYLSENGLLSVFNINMDLTDNNSFVTTDTNQKNAMIKRTLKRFLQANQSLFDCNYFLTNEPYNMLKKYNNNSYDKVLTEAMEHYTFYANDWVSQLSFFNHYIHHSIIYVTGSTGTGKSTQVPKLTLYALKMYDYKNNGRVICTQPRIPPTQENAKRISKEMGVDIVEVKNKIEYKTDQYYIMYKHMKDSHLRKYNNHLTLKMVTDGTLLEELVKNPTLKEQAMMRVTDFEQEYFLTTDNLYDIVMVDEAHEHNANMDLILTLMRQVCMYNNSIRLIIISATMDDDEPIYRSYYKLVNDNIAYPIKQPLLSHPLLGTSINFRIDSFYLDRRIHISIPKQSYSYKITEYYNEAIEKQFTDNMKHNSDLAQNESYELIRSICNKTLFGDILLFSVGKEEIKSAVRSLNRIIPANVIALPFYSEMNSAYRDIISNIDTRINLVRNKKENITEEWATDWIDSKDMPEGTYKRAIIIATNVAEASMTIGSLRYVVDTGFAKVSRFDVLMDSLSINIEHISESSRIQRKGRIGRVAEGTVYYLYGKNKRLHVKPKYGITLTDFHQSFIKLSSKNVFNEKTLYWESELNPYLFQNFYLNMKKLIFNSGLENTSIYRHNIYQMLIEQFTLLYNPIPPAFYYPFNELNNDTLPDYLNRVEDGYTFIQLMDIKGQYYIIHPYENMIGRNIMGQVISVLGIGSIELNRRIFDPMFHNMRVKLLYVPIDYKSDKNIRYFKKTTYFEKISSVMNITRLEEKDATILLLACGYNLLYEGCEVICMLKAINNNPTSLMGGEGRYVKYNEMRQIFGSNSDITSIHMVCKLLREKLSDMLIYTIYSKPRILENFRNQYNYILDEYKKKNYNAILESLDLMHWLYNNGRLDTNKGFLHWIKSSGIFRKILLNDLNRTEINKICNQYFLNYTTIMNYYDILIDIIINVLSADIEFDEDYNVTSPFKWASVLNSNLLKIVTKNTIEEKLNLCFFLSQPYYFSVIFKSGYKSLRSVDCAIKPFVKGWLNTFCTDISSYIGYYNYSNNIMSIIFNVDINKITSYYPIFYNPYAIKNIYAPIKMDGVKLFQYHSNEWDRFIMVVSNTFSNISFDRFPLNTPEFPTIQDYIKQIKYSDTEH